jgi:hypothetical protein
VLEAKKSELSEKREAGSEFHPLVRGGIQLQITLSKVDESHHVGLDFVS